MIGDELKGDEKMFTTSNIMHILPASSATSLLGKLSVYEKSLNQVFCRKHFFNLQFNLHCIYVKL